MSKGELLLQEEKLYIMTTNKVSGIYTITNKITDKLYIGESLDIYRRWHKEHIPKLRKKQHYNKELQNDFNKYGEENFSFEVLERYSGNDPISTKARILILESYFITQFEKAEISLYNAENSLVEILNGNKIPEAGNTLVYAIANVLANYTIKECEGFAYFEKYKTIKGVLFGYVTLKKESQASVIKAFEKYLEDNGNNKYYYTHKHPVNYVINGKKIRHEEDVVRNDKIKELEKMAILFSEYYDEHKKANKKETTSPMYESIKDGEVRFSILFKEFAEKGLLPANYDYLKVREYLVNYDVVYLKEFNMNNVRRKITFATDNALDKDILRIIGSKKQGEETTYNYVFTKNGVEFMRKLFSDLDEKTKINLFVQDNVA